VKYKIALLPGDGVGPEVVSSAGEVVKNLTKIYKDLYFELVEAQIGAKCYFGKGSALPEETIETISNTDVALFGAVSTADLPSEIKSPIIQLRQRFDLYANIRLFKTYPNVPCFERDVDIIVVRENTEGLYCGIEFKPTPHEDTICAIRVITRRGCERIIRKAFEIAKKKKRKKVTAVHKQNVLRLSDGLFRDIFFQTAKEFPEIESNEMLVDAMAMQLIRKVKEHDVIVTTNMFGDILTDELAGLTGGLGMIPSGNIGDNFAIFEPAHGSAPKYAGKNVVNPIATIFSVKLMLEWLGYKFHDQICINGAEKIESSVTAVLREGNTLTYDLGGKAKTTEVTQAIVEKMLQLRSTNSNYLKV